MTTIVLPAILDLSAATLLRGALHAETGPIVLNGANVERIGVAGLQLLLSARVTSDATGRALAIERPSAALQAAARTIGADLLLAPSC